MIKLFEWEGWTNATPNIHPEVLRGEWHICLQKKGLRWLRHFHTKQINSGIDAYNVIFGFIPSFGKFKILSSQTSVVFKYDNDIIDMVRLINNNRLIGKLFYKNKFIGYFTMERILKDGRLVTSKASRNDEAYSV